MEIIDQRLARVTVETREGGRRTGSGLVLGERLVLTALELVEADRPVRVDAAVRGGVVSRRATVTDTVARLGIALLLLEEKIPVSGALRHPWGALSAAQRRIGAALTWWPEDAPEARTVVGSLADIRPLGGADEFERFEEADRGRYLVRVGAKTGPRFGALLLAGRSFPVGIVVDRQDGRDVVVSLQELHQDGELAWLCRSREAALPRVVPLRAPTPAFFMPVLGILIGSSGIFAGLLVDDYLTGAAVWLTVFATVFAAWRLQSWYRHRHEIRSRLSAIRSGLLVALALVCVCVLDGLVFFAPAASKGGEPYCAYDVAAQIAVPLEPGGLIQGSFVARAHAIKAVSVIAGLDETLTSLEAPHPLKIRLWAEDGSVDVSVNRPDLGENNGFTRFQFEREIALERGKTYLLRVTNDSPDQIVSLYTTRVGGTEVGTVRDSQVLVVEQVGNPSRHWEAGWAVSGCVEALR
ncbi:hypothetical protein EDD29_4977 [Actinocorallia herbida]|uniref:Uncharacterized protein n=1 Tax=Actinocorallia herbida TaxID=58109 RepID=A0A3N1D1H3_9ACTN|nr:hypothetical protein [Actinocorallia herbida]ROO87375.1 hypothetical protein EDD29_4977 [Actinocorallia herbida]